MKPLLAVCLVLALAGCGTLSEDSDAAYIMVSKGRASGLSRIMGAGIDYCKATARNLGDSQWMGEVIYEGDTCRVEVTGGKQ